MTTMMTTTTTTQTKKLSIIERANSAFALPSQSQQSSSYSNMSLDERLDAARSLLGISPCSVTDTNVANASGAASGASSSTLFGGRMLKPTSLVQQPPKQASSQQGGESTASEAATRPRSNSAGLDALAFLATQEQESTGTVTQHGMAPPPKHPQHGLRLMPPQHLWQPLPPTVFSQPLVAAASTPVTSSSSDDDSEVMPPPPPRMVTRRRSMSNPEGMDRERKRFQLVLPAAILEEELAEASAAMKAKEEEEEHHHYYEEEEEEELDQDELLRRARSRLLEDLSQSHLHGEKGEITLPHSLEKYKEVGALDSEWMTAYCPVYSGMSHSHALRLDQVYNRNGRVGIYTPAERAAIIARFHNKRSRRVWNKKIRYNCRKNLADRRLRVKGRFVKRSTLEEQEQQKEENAEAAGNEKNSVSFALDLTEEQVSPEREADEDMPDVDDPDAGFCPTEDQPYRRRRRHTIT
jgi:hypothetical protein